MWVKHSSFSRKSQARKIAAMLREPGGHRVRARVVREIYWRVDWKPAAKPETKEGA
jgi:hypothetical protein